MGWYAIFRCFGVHYGLVAQLVVHVLGKHEVGSPSLPETSKTEAKVGKSAHEFLQNFLWLSLSVQAIYIWRVKHNWHCLGLENRSRESVWEFESLTLRQRSRRLGKKCERKKLSVYSCPTVRVGFFYARIA